MKKLSLLATLLAPVLVLADENATAPVAAAAAAAPKLDGANTAWVLMATALVMLMTPAGLALFYGGMTRAKNLLNTVAMSFVGYAIASIVWVLWAYSLAFGADVGGYYCFTCERFSYREDEILYMDGVRNTLGNRSICTDSSLGMGRRIFGKRRSA